MSNLAPPPPPGGIKPAPAPVQIQSAPWQTGTIAPPPPRLIINGVEGIGKTSTAVNAPGAAIIMARGETGYETLLGADRVPMIPRIKADNWPALLSTIRSVAQQPGDIKTLVLDALGGFERLCHEHVCDRDFKGDWSEKGFMSFHRGYDVAVKDWIQLIHALDTVHAAGVGVIVLSHVAIKSFNNPEGPAFDRYQADCHAKTWSPTHKWADAVLFFNFQQTLETKDQRTRGLMHGGRQRVMYTTRSDAYDAKNRYGMPVTLQIPEDPAAAWGAIAQHIPFYNQKG